MAGWVVLYEWFQRGSHEVRQNDFAFLVCGILGVLLFLACLQQFILRSAGWPVPLWAVCTGLGLLVGWVPGLVVGEIGVSLRRSYPWAWVLAISGTTITWGCILGLIQFSVVRGGSLAHLVWMFSNGLAMCAAASTIFLFPRFPFIPLEQMIGIAALMGGCYGLITGGTLAWLLAREHPGHRRNGPTSSE